MRGGRGGRLGLVMVGVLAEGLEVGVGCIAGDFATGADDEAGAGFLVALVDGLSDGVGVAIPDDFDGVDVAEEDLVGAHLVAAGLDG
ncbi:MAG: hypothetical protein RI897_138 [Verrucomicrobiota bacterium]